MAYKLIAFDMDGTLTLSKSAIDNEMVHLLENLSSHYLIAIISWGDFPQFQKQFLPYLHLTHEQLRKIFILPTCGTKFFRYDGAKFYNLYEDPLDTEDKKNIISVLMEIYEGSWYKPHHIYGEIIEDRSTQITFSALWQDAPLSEKEHRDPTRKKREQIIHKIAPLFPAYSFNYWWTTSIDITKLWIDKSFGMKKLMEIAQVSREEIAFIGDRLQPWGNDYPVKAMWIDSREVSWPGETKQLIKKLFLVSN